MKLRSKIASIGAATVLATAGLGVFTAPYAQAANTKVKNHSTSRSLQVRDACGSQTIPATGSRYLSCSGRQILVPTGWILTKDSVQWRGACWGQPSYWSGISFQVTTVDIRWVRCVNP